MSRRTAGYVLCKGTVACSGNPRELLAEIRRMGYDECIRCKLNLKKPNVEMARGA